MNQSARVQVLNYEELFYVGDKAGDVGDQKGTKIMQAVPCMT